MPICLKEKAIFIADSHYPHHGAEFLDILNKIKFKELDISQLFLMGDNFDLLFGHIKYIKSFSQEAIDILNEISCNIDVYYLEGNHDFNLKSIFPNINVYKREYQPLECSLSDKRVALSHGDKYTMGFGYNLYSKILRSTLFLKLVSPISGFIIKYQMNALKNKNICHEYFGFENRIDNILKHYEDYDLVIEGHYHQSKVVGKYISLPSLACQGEVGIIEDGRVAFKQL